MVATLLIRSDADVGLDEVVFIQGLGQIVAALFEEGLQPTALVPLGPGDRPVLVVIEEAEVLDRFHARSGRATTLVFSAELERWTVRSLRRHHHLRSNW